MTVILVEPAPAIERTQVLIVGTGFAGMAMAAKLLEAGIDDFILLEKADAIGGTWRDNHYPGCACDIPAHLYSFSFAPNAEWTSAYAPQPEIRAYLERCASDWQLHQKVRFGAHVERADLDQRGATWTVRTTDGRRFQADALVAALGGLSRPSIPKLPGLERFAGPTWHSAQWDHRTPIAGKRVAVIGTGASAIQFVPRIAPEVARLDLYQRTPPWIMPRPDRTFSPAQRWAYRHVPGLRRLYRAGLYLQHEIRALPFALEPRLLKYAQPMARRHLHRQITDPALRARLTPDYVMGCKRILISNDFYPALARPNVALVTDGIRELTRDGIVTTDGTERQVDAIVFGTGFAIHDYLGGLQAFGRGGAELGARWRREPEAYLGTMVDGFPNLFTLIGPNTGLGHTSMIVMIEAQVRLVVSCLQTMRDRGIASVEPRADVVRRYNDELQRRLGKTVWATGCKSWYLDESGKNTTVWPGFTVEFAARTWRFDPAKYVLRGKDELGAVRSPLLDVPVRAASVV